MGDPYKQGWGDCLGAVLRILQRAKDVKDDAKG